MNTVIINLVGGPGVGKSTMAARLFAELKMSGKDCELVTEVAKEKIWEGATRTLDDQLYIFAKQNHRVWRLIGKVEYVITDSPTIMSILYDKNRDEHLKETIKSIYEKQDNITYFIERETIYNTNGRIQTEDEAKSIDKQLKQLLDNEGIMYKTTTPARLIPDVIADLRAREEQN